MRTRAIHERTRFIPGGLAGAVRRVVAGARHEIDHAHEDLEFNLVIRGAGAYRIGRDAHPLKPGTLIWLVPGQRHSLCRSPFLEMWVVVVRPELVEGAWLPGLAAEPSRHLPGEELIDLDALLSQVAQDSDEPAVYNAGVAYALQRAWRVSRDRVAQRPAMHPAVTRALLRLRESEATLSLDALAAGAGVTAPYLSRLLIEHTGRGFVEWRNRIRLERFMAAWRPGANLLGTALEAGFGSYAQFHRIFGRLVGCSPGDWVRSPAAERPSLASSPPLAAGVPAASALSTRQRWTGMLAAVAPSVRSLLGGGFLARVLTPAAGTPAMARPPDGLDDTLPVTERLRFVAGLGLGDASQEREFRRLLEGHDFGAVLAWVLPHYGLSSASLADAATALLVIVWVAAARGVDPPVPQARAVSRQVQRALAGAVRRLDQAEAQAALTALLCHFVIAFHALQATRASGDPREAEQLAAAARSFGRIAFDGDLAGVALTGRGFAGVAAAPSPPPRSAAGGRV
ncbi:MAG: helix-turn-helix transcriptional regulator [Geminicoccaceae bacterium]